MTELIIRNGHNTFEIPSQAVVACIREGLSTIVVLSSSVNQNTESANSLKIFDSGSLILNTNAAALTASNTKTPLWRLSALLVNSTMNKKQVCALESHLYARSDCNSLRGYPAASQVYHAASQRIKIVKEETLIPFSGGFIGREDSCVSMTYISLIVINRRKL